MPADTVLHNKNCAEVFTQSNKGILANGLMSYRSTCITILTKAAPRFDAMYGIALRLPLRYYDYGMLTLRLCPPMLHATPEIALSHKV